VFLGGEAESAVSGITWTSWGGEQSRGNGTGCYYSSNEAAYQCARQPEALIAFDLGTCKGTYMHQRLEEYFPQEGENFDPNKAMDICKGQ